MEITKGKCVTSTNFEGLRMTQVRSEGELIASVYASGEETFHSNEEYWLEAEANANLITEAFNVANDTGFSPRQLAEQNKKLVKLLTEIQAKKPLHPLSSGSTFYIKAEYDREYKKWMKIEKALKQSN